MNVLDLIDEYRNREIKNKNKWVAFFLCLFLGFLGAHKFYEGKFPTGILYLCTGGLFAVGWIADLIDLFLLKPYMYEPRRFKA